MAKKKLYEESFEVMNPKNSTFEGKNNFLNNRVEDYFENNYNNYTYAGESGDYEIYETTNRKKTFGKDKFFVEKNPNTYKVGIYKIKDNLSSYSPVKNSELVYKGKLDEGDKGRFVGKGVYSPKK